MRRNDPAGAERQRLLRMLAASLALHALAFAWLKAPLHTTARLPDVPALIASLRLAASGEPQQKATLPQPMAAASKPEARRTMTRRDARAQPAVSEAAGPTVRHMPPAPIPAVAAVAAQAAQSVDAPLPASTVADTGVPATRDSASPTPADAEQLLAAYGRRLSAFFSQRQQYPRLAVLRGWEGEVRVRLSVARQGTLSAVRLERSSGFDVLDRHALAMIGEMAHLPAPPAAFDGDVDVVVPVSYRLRKPA